jgi:poly(3-hydroxybutyrate) depolymerase
MQITIPILCCFFYFQPTEIPAGSHDLKVRVGNNDLQVFTYKPQNYTDGPLVLVFHGTLRNAEEYRDWAKVIGDKLGAIIAAPLFEQKAFPVERYQLGGLTRDGKPQPESEWTWSYVPNIANELRRRENRREMPYSLIGHSAGGQFLVRLAGFVRTEATRIVAANPGSLLFATEEMPFPYGFGELPDSLGGEPALKKFLAQPLTLYLGTADTIQDKYFPKGRLPNLQGSSRYERGQNAYKTAEQLATAKKWDFNWKLIEAADVGHNAAEMFRHAACLDALGYPNQSSKP